MPVSPSLSGSAPLSVITLSSGDVSPPPSCSDVGLFPCSPMPVPTFRENWSPVSLLKTPRVTLDLGLGSYELCSPSTAPVNGVLAAESEIDIIFGNIQVT